MIYLITKRKVCDTTLTIVVVMLKWYHKLSFLLSGISYYYNDMVYFRKQSNLGAKNNSEERMRASLTASYHIIEKGLSMPNRRLGFGQERLISLIKECERYYTRGDRDTAAQRP